MEGRRYGNYDADSYSLKISRKGKRVIVQFTNMDSGVESAELEIEPPVAQQLGTELIVTSRKRSAKKVIHVINGKLSPIPDPMCVNPEERLHDELSNILAGEKIPLHIYLKKPRRILIRANERLNSMKIRKLVKNWDNIILESSPIQAKIQELISETMGQEIKIGFNRR